MKNKLYKSGAEIFGDIREYFPDELLPEFDARRAAKAADIDGLYCDEVWYSAGMNPSMMVRAYLCRRSDYAECPEGASRGRMRVKRDDGREEVVSVRPVSEFAVFSETLPRDSGLSPREWRTSKL